MVPEIELNQSCVRLEKDSSSNGENHWNKLVARKGNNIQIIQISFCLKNSKLENGSRIRKGSTLNFQVLKNHKSYLNDE